MLAKSSWDDSLCFCCMVRQKICCMPLEMTDMAATAMPAGLSPRPTSVIVLQYWSAAITMSNKASKHTNDATVTTHSTIATVTAYTTATPATTIKTEAITPLVNSLPSQNFSTRQTNGMMSSLAICKTHSIAVSVQCFRGCSFVMQTIA